MTMIDTEAMPKLALTAFDRCDRCGSQALMKASKGELELLFCGHHGKEHKDALKQQRWVIVGDSEQCEAAGYTYEKLGL